MKKHTNRLIALLVLLALLLGSFCSAELSLDEGGSNEIPAASQSTEPASTIGADDDSKLITSPDSTPDPNASIDPAASSSPVASVEPSASVDPEASVEPSASVDPEASVKPSASVDPEASVEPAASSSPEASVDPYAIMLLEGDDEEGLNGTTTPVDSSTTLADGTYTPEDFSFSGGSGKTTISCTKLTVSGGKATATIAFSSSSYTYVKASGGKFDASVVDGKSSFDIPVDLNADNSIIGCTTAMGTPKEIEYTIHVTLAEPEAPSTDPDDLVDYEDGDYTIGIESTFSMFKIVSTRATVSGGKVRVTISTAKPTYDRIHLGSKNDEASYPDYIQGTSNEQGGYDFSFSLPASYMGASIDFVPGKPDGSWYSKKQYQLTIPAVLEKPADPVPVKTFEVKSVYASQDGDVLNVVLTTDSQDFDRIFIGTISAASKTPYYVRRTMADGSYYYEFTLPASNLGQEVRFVPGCSDGSWHDAQLSFTLPAAATDLPELPADETYGDGDYTAAVPVFVESGSGLANSAMGALYTEITIQGDTLLVTIWNRSTSYNQLYVGRVGDTDVTVINRVEETGKYSDAYYRYSFTLPKSALGTMVPIVPGKDGVWITKQNYLAIPKYLTVVSLNPTEPDPIEDGEYNTPVESSSSMFKVVACVLTARDGKYTATVTLSGTGYDKLYLGTAADAATADESALIPFVPDADGKYTYSFPVEALDTPIAIAAHSSSKDSWYDRTLTFLSEGMEKIEAEPDPIEDGEYNTPVESSSSMFKVVACVLTARDGKYTATVTLSGTGYDKLYLGTAADAATADESALIPFVPDADGKYTYSFPVEALDTPIAIAAHSSSKDSWYDRTLTFLSEGMEKIGSGESGATPVPSPSESAEPTSTPEADLSGSTSRVDSSTSLPDGVYTPDKFSFSGGTGKVGINCTKVTVSGGKATATLVFSSPNYSYVKANGNKYYGSHSGSSSTFQIPVKLNANNRIIGMTTAMSQDHEVEYTIYIYLAAADEAAGAAAAAGAPEIAGLRFESADEIEHATLFTIFRYEGGFIVIDVVDVGSFLLVPEGAEVPTGAAEDATLIQLPVQSAYVASESAMALIDGIEIPAEADPVTLTGCEGLALRRMALLADGGQLSFAGAWSAPDYTTLLMSGCDLAILTEPFSDAETVDEADRAIAAEVADRLGLLGVPAFVDRSAAEETELGRLEWIRVYGAIFGCEDAANAAYEAAVAALEV